MRRILLFAFAFCVVMPAFAQEQLALITELSGTVVIDRANGSNQEARWGTQLFEGDVVRTESGSTASILYANSKLVTLEANSEADISEDGSSGSGSGVDPTLLADVSDLTLHRTGVGEVSALGGLRSAGARSEIELLSPLNSVVGVERPTFVWSAAGAFDEYTVSVMSDAGVVWTGTATDGALAYPVDAPALEAGATYYWKVEAEDMLDVVASELASFSVPSNELLEQLSKAEAEINALFQDDPGSASRDFMLGSYYAKSGLAAQAIESFERIAANHGDSALVQEILGKLYFETGQKDRSIAALKRAVELGHSQ